MDKTVCELFAGVGGFRLGLEQANKDWKTVWFSQWEPGRSVQWAHDCYVSHWGDIDDNTGKDIGIVDKKLIPDHNLLVGGFPCQDYSVARTLKGSSGLQGKKGVLWWQIRDIIQEKKAPFILLENVDRLLKSPASQRGRDFGVILACLASLNYSVEWRVVNAADYGAGQRRRRTFIFAYRNNTTYGKHINRYKPLNVVNKNGFFATTFPITPLKTLKEGTIDFSDIPEISDSFNFLFKKGGFMCRGKIYTADIEPIQEEPIPLRNLLEHHVDEKFYLGKNLDKWNYLKGSKQIARVAQNGHKYIYSEGPVGFPDSIDKPARTMLTSESSVNRSTHVIEDPETKRLRLITPLEAERIQGFKDNWTDTGMPFKFRYFCMGNALVVPMITRMGKTLNTIFEAEK